MPTTQQLVQVLGVGKAAARSVPDVEQALGIPRLGTNNDKTRAFVRAEILGGDLPIGADRDGYWIIDSGQEFTEALDQIDHRIRKLEERRLALIRGWAVRQFSKSIGQPWPK